MNRVEIRELECFVAVAEQLNFSRAARQLNLSQPPLTRHVQALEGKLGTRLLERDTRSVSLTNAGRLFLQDARQILSHLDRASEAARRAESGEVDRLRLAFVGALLDAQFVALIQSFRQAHPACQLQMSDLLPSAQLAALKEGGLDGGFIGARPSRELKEIALTVWKREPLLLALPENHPLAGVKVLKWEHLGDLPWIMVSREAAPAFRHQFAELCRANHISGRIIQEADRVPAILTMVAAGSGVTLVPETSTHLITKGVVFRSLRPQSPMLDHTFAYPKQEQSKSLQSFLKLLKQLSIKE